MLGIPRWFNESHVEYLPEEYQSLVTEIGFENMLKVVSIYQGGSPYFPQLESSFARVKQILILKESNGYNRRELARKYGVTERWVYKILANARQ